MTAGLTPKGKPRKVSGTCKTKAEAERMLAQAMVAKYAGQLGNGEQMTLGDYCKQWLDRREKENNLAPSTLHQYRLYLDTYVREHIKKVKLKRLNAEHLRAIDQVMLQRTNAAGTPAPLTVATRTKLFVILRMVLKAAEDDGILARGTAPRHRVAATQADKLRPSTKKAIDPDDLDALLPAADDHPLMVIPWLLFGLGVRRAEMLGLRWSDIDWAEHTATIAQQVRMVGNRSEITPILKTDAAYRTLTMAPELIIALREHQARQVSWKDLAEELWTETGLIVTTQIGTGVGPRNVNRVLEQMTRKAEIKRITSHVGRHTQITGQLRDGVSPDVVAARAGHRNSGVTIKAYRRVLADELRKGAFSILSYRASGSPKPNPNPPQPPRRRPKLRKIVKANLKTTRPPTDPEDDQ